MTPKSILYFLSGLLILFFIYHFPEFFNSFWLMAACKIGFLVVAFVLARLQGWKGLGGYGLGFTNKWAADLVKGLLTGLFFFALSVFVSIQLGYEEITAVSTFSQVLNQLPMLLLMTAIPSVAEDILTRGYLFAHLKFMKPVWWILLSSAVYVLNHIWRLSDGAAVLTYLFLLGLVLAAAVWIKRSLWLAFGIHWGANIAFESTNSMVQTKTIVQHEGPVWILAGTWALLLLVFVIKYRKKEKPI